MSAPRRAVPVAWLGPAVVAGGAAAVLALGGACGESSHPYLARQLLEARGCLGPEETVDVVEGSELERACEPTCVIGQRPFAGDGGAAAARAFVTTTCPPAPFGFDLSGTDPRCPSALAAHARRDRCLSDGGSTAPAPDAAPDAPSDDASPDAS